MAVRSRVTAVEWPRPSRDLEARAAAPLDHRRTAVALAADELRHEAIVIDLSGADAVRLLPRDH
jgi:hypothetical protein